MGLNLGFILRSFGVNVDDETLNKVLAETFAEMPRVLERVERMERMIAELHARFIPNVDTDAAIAAERLAVESVFADRPGLLPMRQLSEAEIRRDFPFVLEGKASNVQS